MNDAFFKHFWDNIDKTNTCWNWKGKLKNKAPIIAENFDLYFITAYPRRISLHLHDKFILGPVLTSCKNKICVNPDHLISGDEARFFNYIEKLPELEGGCWHWKGALDKSGYGEFSAIIDETQKRKCTSSHIYSWILHNGPRKSKDSVICHKCDNPKCCNPTHLFEGTTQDNIKDKISKNRQAKGSSLAWAKITEDQVIEIRKLYATGNFSYLELGSKFGIAPNTVSYIINKRNWKHV